MPSHAIIKTSNSKIDDSTAPQVVVFVGGTAGIGRAALELLVSKRTPIKVYVIGRNGSAHESFLESLRASNPRATIQWLEGQVTLLSEVRRLCDEIKRQVQWVDILFLSAGFLPFGGRTETSEGLESSTVLNFWGRALFTELLLPLLRTRPTSDSPFAPRVISILAAGEETDAVPLDDLHLRQPANFGVTRIGPLHATLNTVFLSQMASQPENHGVVFIHNHPGVVATGITQKNWGDKWWGPLIVRFLEPLLHFFLGTSIDTSAERSLYLMTAAEYGGRGVQLQNEARIEGLTDTKAERGGLFCVSKDMDCVQPRDVVVAGLRAKNGYDIIMEETRRILSPYL